MFGQDQQVEIGKIVAPHGVRGEVRVVQLSEFAEQVAAAAGFQVEGRGVLAVESMRGHKQLLLIKFVGINDMDAANALRNRRVFLSRAQIGGLPAGRYYIEDLIGLQVVDQAGNLLGELAEVLPTGSNDVYVVKKEGREDLLLPALKTVIKQVDLAGRVMRVEPPVWE